MKKAAMIIVASALVTSPVQAADWSEVRTGTFIGARLTIGGRHGAKPSMALAVAPTQNHILANGMTSMRIGQGLALNLAPGTKPTLTLAGVRADTALGLHRNGNPNAGQKHGMSTGGVVVLALGTAAIIAGGLYLAADHIADCDEGECD